jgi:hypothetical protein
MSTDPTRGGEELSAVMREEAHQADSMGYDQLARTIEDWAARVQALEQERDDARGQMGGLRVMGIGETSDEGRSRHVHQGSHTDSMAEQAHDCPWKDAILNAAIVDWIYTSEHEQNPRKAVNDLLTHQISLALDPAVSEQAAEWMSELERLREERRLARGSVAVAWESMCKRAAAAEAKAEQAERERDEWRAAYQNLAKECGRG